MRLPTRPPSDPSPPHVRVAVIGSGFGGIGTAIRLRQEGVDDFLIFERAGEVGGVWRDNRYPGAACDVQSHLYSFSFAPNPGWSRSFSPQPEIWAYLLRCAEDFGLRPHLRFHHDVREVAWDEEGARWRIETSRGPYTASVLVAAVGALSEPAIPELPGLDTFRGEAFHSARWPEGFDPSGRRVAVIGTGASAIQFVPAIQPEVERLYLYQRTPAWVLPRLDRSLSAVERRLFRRVPALQRAARAGLYVSREFQGLGFRHPKLFKPAEWLARCHLRKAISDPALRAKLTPDYTIGCKRILLSNDYYPALAQPNVEVVTEGIAEVRPHGIVSRDGTERPVDAIVFGTGFRVTDLPFAHHARGRGGLLLADAWAGTPKAYLGTTLAGFPNLFILQGPNTGLGHTSVITMIEAQVEHVMHALRYMERHSVAALEPRPEAQAAFVAEVDAQMEGTVWASGGCRSWYLDASGRNAALWPGSTWAFRRRAARFEPGDYRMLPHPALADRERQDAGTAHA